MTGFRPPTFPWNLVPVGRQGTFEELSGSILHMVGKGGAYMDGNVMLADGGRLSVFEGTY